MTSSATVLLGSRSHATSCSISQRWCQYPRACGPPTRRTQIPPQKFPLQLTWTRSKTRIYFCCLSNNHPTVHEELEATSVQGLMAEKYPKSRCKPPSPSVKHQKEGYFLSSRTALPTLTQAASPSHEVVLQPSQLCD
jgi:hypothetical protein